MIFLPTEMMTGTGAYINAPFYGSLDRRQINFDNAYNDMLSKACWICASTRLQDWSPANPTTGRHGH